MMACAPGSTSCSQKKVDPVRGRGTLLPKRPSTSTEGFVDSSLLPLSLIDVIGDATSARGIRGDAGNQTGLLLVALARHVQSERILTRYRRRRSLRAEAPPTASALARRC